MNNKIRILAALISIIFCLSGMMLTVYATGGPGDSGNSGDSGSAPTEYTPPPAQDPTTDQRPDVPTSAPTSAPTQAPNPGGNTDTDTDYDNGYDDDYYYDPESDPDDDGISNTGESAGSVSENTNLFNPNVNNQELAESEWSNITLDTSSNQTNNNVADFSAIKEDSSANDNGQGMLYVGIALIGLSVIGILYYIIATAKYRKKLNKLRTREQGHRERHRTSDYYNAATEEYPTQEDYNRRYQRRYSDTPYTQRRQTKFDTADIPTGRYKSRH